MKNTIYILILALVFASCKKEATVWETDWNAPVINDTLSLANLVNDSTIQEVSGFYELDMKRTLFDLDINEIVAIPDTTIHKDFTNGGWQNFPVQAGSSIFQTPDEQEHDLSLEDLQLKELLLKEGTITMQIQNPLETKLYFDLGLPGFIKDGVPFSEVYEIPAGTVANPGVKYQTIDISGYTVELTGLSGTDYNKFVALVDVMSDPNGETILFGDEHVVVIDATFAGIKLDYARGYFGSRIIAETTEFDIAELDIYESGLLDLSTMTLGFEIENGIKVGAQGTLNSVFNTNALSNTVHLSGANVGTPFNVDPATGIWNSLTPSINNVEFTSANSNIEAYLENLGVKHTIDYKLHLNPWGNVSGTYDEIYPQSRLRVSVTAQMPLAIGMDQLILKDTFDVDLNQNAESTRVVSGEFILNTSNAFPFSADVTFYLLDENGAVLHTVEGSEKIEASQYGAFSSDHNFFVADSEIHFLLTDEVVTDINNVEKIIVKSKFNSTSPTTNTSEQMIIPIDAFLSVKLKTKFKSENRL